MKKINFTLTEDENVLAEFNANNTNGLCCFFKKYNESSVVITDRRIIAITKLGLKVCCGCFGSVTTTFKEALITGLSGVNSYACINEGICCCTGNLFRIDIGLVDGNSISFSPNVKTEDQAQAILHKIAEIIEQTKK